MSASQRGQLRRLASIGAGLLAGALVTLGVRLLLDEGALESSSFRFLAPDALLLLGALPLVPLLAASSRAKLTRRGAALALLARLTLLAALVVALARPAHHEDATRTSTVILVDVSPSVSDEALERTRGQIQALLEARQASGASGERAPHVELVTFAAEPQRVRLPAAGEPVTLDRHDDASPATDLASAIRFSEALFAEGHAQRLWIVTDGLETRGSALSTLASLLRRKVRVSVTPEGDAVASEVALTGLSFPDLVRAGQPFDVRVHVRSTRANRARVRLQRDGRLVGLDGVQELELAQGDDVVTFRTTADERGTSELRATIEPIEPADDHFPDNNQFVRAIEIVDRPRVLVLSPDPGRTEAFARVLEAAELRVELRSPRGLPQRARELSSFDAIVLSDTPADQVSASGEANLEAYVRRGGTLLVAGGPRAFGPGGWRGSALERILPVSLDGERRRDTPSLALALVIDRSGSMAGEKLELAKEAARATAELLSPEDSLAVIGFDTVAERIVPLQSAANRVSIQRDLGRLSARGGTAIFPALDAAYQDLAGSRATTRHVILLTDGQANESGIPELVRAMRGDRITVTSVGVGTDVNRTLLSEVADLGGGRAYFTNDPSSIPRIFLREASTVGQSALVEELVRVEAAARASVFRGIDLGRLPLLRGYVVTQARGAPSELLLRSEQGDPILARRSVGEGTTIAWTSDLGARWSADLLRWPSSPRLFGQLLGERRLSDEAEGAPLEARVEDDTLVLSADTFDERDGLRSDVRVEARVEGPLDAPDEERVHLDVTLDPTAPGRLEARVPLTRYGAYAVTAVHATDAGVIGVAHASPVYPYPAEYARLEPDPSVVETLRAATNGLTITTDPARLFELAPEERVEAEAEWTAWVLLAALLLLVLDVLVRRTLRTG